MKLIRDTWLVLVHHLLIFVRNPAWVIIGLVQPMLYLLLFAPLLKSLAATPGFPPGGAYNVFVPGLLVQQGLFGAAGVGFSLIADLRGGVVERMRVTPVSRFALLLGRSIRDILTMLMQSLLLIVFSLPFGLTISFQGVVIMLGLVALIGLMMTSIAYALALKLKSEDSYAPLIFTSSLPLLLLSGTLLPMQFAPNWLRDIANANPLRYAVDAGRAIFTDHLSDPSVGKALIILGILALAGVVTGARSFGRAVA
ncbi:MAG TPA: ABC transporter permease [Candidatus Dormibacteraeota bacterium]|jgi:ABC-2 type transport system permease protein|nr:ABC transporter permease [Candidatus Dormibacteraeota bacterium]